MGFKHHCHDSLTPGCRLPVPPIWQANGHNPRLLRLLFDVTVKAVLLPKDSGVL